MIFQTDDLRIQELRPLIPPAILMEELPLGEQSSATVAHGREQVERILRKQDDRLLAVVGPCSIHDPAAGREYATRLQALAKELREDLLLVMRVYFEKPRTIVGWKGLINDPKLDESFQIEIPPYSQDLADAGKLVSDGWGFIGSFNTEMATGGNMEGGESLEAGASKNNFDYLHAINWKKAEALVQGGGVEKVNGISQISLEQAAAEGILYLIPEPKSPHGIDVDPSGRYLVVGFASGPIPALPFNLALLKGASIVGVFWGDFAKREPKANAAMMAELAQWYAQGKIKPVIDRTMPMAELPAAYAHMGSRGVMGKLVMVN